MIHVAGCRLQEKFPDHEGTCRDGKGQPRIVLPDGKKVLSYARASGYGSALDDGNGLIPWKQANALRGALSRPDLLEKFAAADDGWKTQAAKDVIKPLIAEMEIAGGSETKANKGTDLHRWSELDDLGEPLVGISPEDERDLMAYRYATEEMDHLLVERFCVVDSHRVAGTPDRITAYDGDTYVFDLKTGSVGFPAKMAVQLALYAHAKLYSQQSDGTALREQIPLVNTERAIILNLPAGTGTATAYWLDIGKAWREAVEGTDSSAEVGLVPQVKAWRTYKEWLVPIGGSNDAT